MLFFFFTEIGKKYSFYVPHQGQTVADTAFLEGDLAVVSLVLEEQLIIQVLCMMSLDVSCEISISGLILQACNLEHWNY